MNEQGSSSSLGNSDFAFVWYQTPKEEMTCVTDECGQWKDQRASLSSTLITNVKCESEHIDDNGEDDVLCDLQSRHMNEVNARLFEDADEVVRLQQIDDAGTKNSWDHVTNSWLTGMVCYYSPLMLYRQQAG